MTAFESSLDYLLKLEISTEQTIKDKQQPMEEIDLLGSPPLPLPSTSNHPTLDSGERQRLARFAEQCSPLLYESNERFLSLRSRPFEALFITDLDKLHYEYNLLLAKYRQLSTLVTGLTKATN